MIELIMRTFLLLVWLVIVIACSFGLAQEARELKELEEGRLTSTS